MVLVISTRKYGLNSASSSAAMVSCVLKHLKSVRMTGGSLLATSNSLRWSMMN